MTRKEWRKVKAAGKSEEKIRQCSTRVEDRSRREEGRKERRMEARPEGMKEGMRGGWQKEG